VNALPPYEVGQTLWTVEDWIELDGYFDEMDDWLSLGHKVFARLTQWTVERVTPAGAWIVVRGALPGNTSGAPGRWVSLDPKRHGRTPAEARDKAARLRAYHVARCEDRTKDAQERLLAILAVDVTKGDAQ